MVKGRATQAQVEQGKVKKEDKEGNDEADKTAKDGLKMHGEGLIKVAGWLASEHEWYTRFVRDVHSHLIAG